MVSGVNFGSNWRVLLSFQFRASGQNWPIFLYIVFLLFFVPVLLSETFLSSFSHYIESLSLVRESKKERNYRSQYFVVGNNKKKPEKEKQGDNRTTYIPTPLYLPRYSELHSHCKKTKILKF